MKGSIRKINTEKSTLNHSLLRDTRKINIPEPCPQVWEKMTPKENGRYCASCSTVVVDFTKMTLEEIQLYFSNDQTSHLCGNFRCDQVETPTPLIHKKLIAFQIYLERKIYIHFFKTISLSAVLLLMILSGCRTQKRGRTRPGGFSKNTPTYKSAPAIQLPDSKKI